MRITGQCNVDNCKGIEHSVKMYYTALRPQMVSQCHLCPCLDESSKPPLTGDLCDALSIACFSST